MGKGKAAKIGQETVNQNGYTSVKTSTGWRFKHHLVAEEKLGRELEKDDRVIFVDGDKQNFDPENIQVNKKQIKVNQTYDNRRNSIEDKALLFVEEAPDRDQALQDLRDIVNEVRLTHGFGKI
jgi:hypothetical protein